MVLSSRFSAPGLDVDGVGEYAPWTPGRDRANALSFVAVRLLTNRSRTTKLLHRTPRLKVHIQSTSPAQIGRLTAKLQRVRVGESSPVGLRVRRIWRLRKSTSLPWNVGGKMVAAGGNGF